MEKFMVMLLNNALTVSVLIVAIIFVRLIFRKVPKRILCFLWLIVAIKLLFPFQIESRFGFVPGDMVALSSAASNGAPVQGGYRKDNSNADLYDGVTDVMTNEADDSSYELKDKYISSNKSASDNNNSNTVINKHIVLNSMKTVSYIWLVGFVILLIYCIASYSLLNHKVRASIKNEQGIYECDYISGPFVLGLIRPRIYIPSGLAQEHREYVIKHERAHLLRRDYILKPFGFMLLMVYWFNPFCWISYMLYCRDMECACDEMACLDESREWIAEYCQVLLNFSVPKKIISGCPVAFGATGVKGRVKNIMNYKKPAFWIMILAILSAIAVCICFATTRMSSDSESDMIEKTQDDTMIVATQAETMENSTNVTEDIKQKEQVLKVMTSNVETKISSDVTTEQSEDYKQEMESEKAAIVELEKKYKTKPGDNETYDFGDFYVDVRGTVFDGKAMYFIYDIVNNSDTSAVTVTADVEDKETNYYVSNDTIDNTNRIVMRAMLFFDEYHETCTLKIGANGSDKSYTYIAKVND